LRKADKGFGTGSVRGRQVSNLGRVLVVWGFLLLAIAVLSVPSSASLKDSGTFEAWVSADSLTNGTVWSICRIKDSSYMRIPCRNSHMHSVDEGVVLQMGFDSVGRLTR